MERAYVANAMSELMQCDRIGEISRFRTLRRRCKKRRRDAPNIAAAHSRKASAKRGSDSSADDGSRPRPLNSRGARLHEFVSIET